MLACAVLCRPPLQPGSAMAIGYKLLVYLRCCAGGEAFPPGTARLRHHQHTCCNFKSLHATTSTCTMYARGCD